MKISKKVVAVGLVILCGFSFCLFGVDKEEALVSYWSFNDGTGKDEVGKNTGVLKGEPLFVEGKVGKALSFDGKDDCVVISDTESLDITHSITIAFWVNPTRINIFQGLLQKGPNPTSYSFYIKSNGAVSFGLKINNKDQSVSGGKLHPGEFNYLVGTYDGGVMKLYVNGSCVGANPTEGEITVSPGKPLKIGYKDYLDNPYYQGIIDEVKIYNRALSTEEIQGEWKK